MPQAEWETVVRNVPIVSVDLVALHEGDVLLGRRENEPAKGEWFVPGGRVHRDESLETAVRRVATRELGSSVTVESRLGVYEHFWETADVADADGKHYVPIAFLVTLDADEVRTDDQHGAVRRLTPPVDASDLHPYVTAYLRDAGLLAASS